MIICSAAQYERGNMIICSAAQYEKLMGALGMGAAMDAYRKAVVDKAAGATPVGFPRITVSGGAGALFDFLYEHNETLARVKTPGAAEGISLGGGINISIGKKEENE